MWQLSPIKTIPIWGFRLLEPLFLKSNPKPVVPIDVLSQITTFDPMMEFFITTLFLIILFFPI